MHRTHILNKHHIAVALAFLACAVNTSNALAAELLCRFVRQGYPEETVMGSVGWVVVKFDLDFGSVDHVFRSDDDGKLGVEGAIKNGSASTDGGAKFDSKSSLWTPDGLPYNPDQEKLVDDGCTISIPTSLQISGSCKTWYIEPTADERVGRAANTRIFQYMAISGKCKPIANR